MKVYAEVSINGEPDTSKLTTVDTEGETNPRWNFPLDYTIEEASLQNPGLVVGVKLYCERTLGDRYIGEVNISVKGLFDYRPRVENVLTYTVDGAGDGKLNILYSFGNMFMAPKPSFGEKVLDVGLSTSTTQILNSITNQTKHKQHFFMGYRKFQITLVSAENLPNVRSFGQMKVYAEVSINGDPKTSKRTTVNTDGETNPRWNFSLDYTIEEASLKNLGLVVVVKLYCERTLGDRYIGEVKISVKGLFDSGSRSENELSYNVAGAGDGKLNILYSFGSMFEAPKSSVWKKVLEVGLAVMIEGVVFLLTGDIGDL
ncbi:hypothetical protein SASPL_148106 [Salvia splendens]|uniref:C2 domain-containing protein n=2 Tax=Salvia splendens TaxID=180675 RepID=A0A8X8Z326_SALSN|nr:hypothetical protein SASPL_148106 [Salvia splendens]